MATTVSAVLDESRVLLNDQAAKLYTNTVMLGVFKKAYRELRQQLADNGISTTRELSEEFTIPTDFLEMTFASTPPLPPNFLYPIKLEEKLPGEPDNNYVTMTETVWSPDISPDGRLRYWDWRQNILHFPSNTGTIILRIKFWGELPEITDPATDEVAILDSETFLAARCASIAATTIGGSPTKGEILQNDASAALAILLSTAVKNRQATPTRRRPFRGFRSTFWR